MSSPALQSPPDHEPAVRALPSAIGPERSVLSSLLQDRGSELHAIALERGLSAAHFYVPAHALLFRVVSQLHDTGQPVELVSLTQQLENSGQLEIIGGPADLTAIFTYSATVAHFEYHLGLLLDAALLRTAISACTEGIAGAYQRPESVSAYLDQLETSVLAIAESADACRSTYQPARAFLADSIQAIEDAAAGRDPEGGLSSGFPDLDRLTGGLRPGELTVIAARPSMGKTSLLLNILEHITLDLRAPALFFSLEMTAAQIVRRLLFSRARFPLAQLRPGIQLTKCELGRLTETAAEIEKAPLHLDDTSAIDIAQVRAKARRAHKQHGLQLIALDYLQIARSHSTQANNSREREIAEISAGLKAIAKELHLPVVVAAQLNRENTKRTVHTPRMSDIRDSGSVEQDADLVALLHRPEYYQTDEPDLEPEEDLQGIAELLLAKNRNGPTGPVPLTFLAEFMCFESRSRH